MISVKTAALASSLLLLGRQSQAAGFGIYEQGAIDQGTSYAGASARAEDPTTLFYNPAGITRLPGYQISINASLIDASSHLAGAQAHTTGLLGGTPIRGSSGGSATAAVVLPSLYATAALTPDLFVGLAIDSPASATTSYGPGSIARYWALTTKLATIDVAPSLAYLVRPDLSVSGTLLIERESAYVSNAVDFGAVGALSGLAKYGVLPGSADGIGTFRGSNTAFGYQVGALYQPGPSTRLGLEYRSAIAHNLKGDLSFVGVSAPYVAAFPGSKATAKLPTPAKVSLGLAQDLGAWTLLLEAQWTKWSKFETFTVHQATGASVTQLEQYKNGALVAGGAEYRASSTITLRTGVAFDSTPTVDATRNPSVPDGNRYWLSLGSTVRVNSSTDLSIAYSHVFFSNASIALVDQGPGTRNALRGNLTAQTHNSADIASLQSTIRF